MNHIFTYLIPFHEGEDARPSYSDNKTYVFLTNEERNRAPLTRDPTIFYTLTHSITITHNDIRLLEPCAKLNDDVLNKYFTLLSNDKRCQKGYFLPTFFWAMLSVKKKTIRQEFLQKATMVLLTVIVNKHFSEDDILFRINPSHFRLVKGLQNCPLMQASRFKSI
jgi:hypothetical protein